MSANIIQKDNQCVTWVTIRNTYHLKKEKCNLDRAFMGLGLWLPGARAESSSRRAWKNTEAGQPSREQWQRGRGQDQR